MSHKPKTFPYWAQRPVIALVWDWEDDGIREMIRAGEGVQAIEDTFDVIAVDGNTVVFQSFEIPSAFILREREVTTIEEHAEGMIRYHIFNPSFDGKPQFNVFSDPPGRFRT